MAKRTQPKAAAGTKSTRRTSDRAPQDPAGPPGPSEPDVAEPRELDHRKRADFAIVGMGASAGGLDAFKKFLEAMPPDGGMAFVLVQHLDPTHESMMVELLARHTEMTVVEVADKMRVEPNHVYMIPPNKYMAIQDGVLRLTEPVLRRGIRVPIDFFMRSLADDQHERAICVVLSGTGTEGTLGLKAVKANGGMTMVQAPETAHYDPMPRSAIATGVVDYVLPVDQMPAMMMRYAKHWYINGTQTPSVPQEKAPDALKNILALLRTRTGYDFRCYKKSTLHRRVARRMGLNHIEHESSYLSFLRDNADEVQQLFKDMLIGVTGFFREPEAFEVLEHEVIPKICADRGSDDAVRIWVAGCSTGEEAYSLAMLLLEHLSAINKTCDIQIFASDIDQDSLDYARAGMYPKSIAADVPPERLQRFFTKVDEHSYHVSKQVRETVVFALQNLISDPPFSKLDLIACRNLLIYLETDVQQRVIALFHFALNDGGYLFLGNSESVGQQDGLYQPVSKKWHVFRKLGPTRRNLLSIPIIDRGDTGEEIEPTFAPLLPRPTGLAQLAQQLLLREYVPASVLINRKCEVLYFYGPTSQYLDLPIGEPTLDLLTMSREGLRTKLRAAIHKADRENQRVNVVGLRVKRNGTWHAVCLKVVPLRAPKDADGLLMVTFEDEDSGETSLAAPAAAGIEPEDALVQHLEQELKVTKEDLQSTIEELETSNEELKASNEEVMSMNEELQSTNEELETSKEELQSLNEELTTVNSQLQEKVEELEAATNDLSNLLASSDVATIFLDRQFCIKRFTPATAKLIRLLPSDIGRPMSDFAQKFSDEHLLDDVQTVLRDLTPIQREVPTLDHHWYIRRVMPYRTDDSRIDGVVITFTDVTIRKESEEQLKGVNEELEQQVADRTRLLGLLHEITTSANEAESIDAAFRSALEIICRSTPWKLGHAFRMNGATDDGQSAGTWYVAQGAKFKRFIDMTRQTPLHMSAAVMEGVRLSGRPYYSKDIRDDKAWTRHKHGDLGIRGSVIFPIRAEGRVAAMLEIYSDQPVEPDALTLAVLESAGLQLGYVIERKFFEQQIADLTESEQRRLGQELHDGLGQQVTGISMITATLLSKMEGESSPHTPTVSKLAASIEQAKAQVRAISKGLMPVEIDAHGLMAALEHLAESTRTLYGVDCTFDCRQTVPLDDTFKARHLYRIAQEAVHNAVKHGHPQLVDLALARDHDRLTLTVRDDGAGIASEAIARPTSGHGLRIMRYRATLIGATLTVQALPTGGTLVECKLPID